ncbi:hypothetical protein D9613_003398 [Agrocybe pediades]|uniref:DUF6534 domain-containing protein n=1 Tax=Agrocybe pediades TaxID=84607 RepID=A0A8H4QNU6_9AGAR|nr:hypothetical protein D9613_003398 [Agrocybe pediades]
MPLLGQPPIRLNLGATLIGAFVNTILYTFELAAAWHYFHTERGKKDRTVIRGIVMLNLLVDAVGSFAVCANAFTFLVIYLDDDNRTSRSHWTLTAYVVTNSISAFVVQGFMVYRYWRFLALLCGSSSLPVGGNEELNVMMIFKSIALAGTAFTDICINVALTWKLRMSSTYSSGTRHLVDRIVTYAIVTGCTTSIFALSVLISYLIYPPSAISTGIAFSLGRVYTLTMIFTLISRDKLSKDPVYHIAIDTEWADSATRADTPPLSNPSTIQGSMQFANPPLTKRQSTFGSTRFRSVSAPPPRIFYNLDDESVYESAVSTLTQLSHLSREEVVGKADNLNNV